ncbi:hypothetical protein ID866_4750 [Astraeus odoratus]|nr:hypothetical protein ID866_4750 [Astraeus odoratus]
MDPLPVDTSNPAIRDYLALVRLQVLTPLSLLINIATVLVCATIIKPSIGQIGYCLLLVSARRTETKNALVKAVGLSLVLANWTMALWAISWVRVLLSLPTNANVMPEFIKVLQFFLVSTILLGILILLLAYSNIALLVYHTPTTSRPLDMALIHAPLRFFLILPLSLMFPYSLL